MLRFIGLSLLVSLSLPHYLAPDDARTLIIWNVGQGQWITLSTVNACIHIDVGGEFAPWRDILRNCGGGKPNMVALSHWDWDHIGMVGQLKRRLPSLCIGMKPLGPASQSKQRLLQGIPACDLATFHDLSMLAETHLSARARPTNNELSHVYVAAGRILLPGDSPANIETKWVPQIRPGQIKWLVLGHHGSRTSTSQRLLKRLPGLNQAIASARKRRYGHPHRETLARLKKARIPTLSTEEWGSIYIEL